MLFLKINCYKGQRFYEISLASHQYLTNFQSWKIRFGRQTKHPSQKFTSMNFLQMPKRSKKCSFGLTHSRNFKNWKNLVEWLRARASTCAAAVDIKRTKNW